MQAHIALYGKCALSLIPCLPQIAQLPAAVWAHLGILGRRGVCYRLKYFSRSLAISIHLASCYLGKLGSATDFGEDEGQGSNKLFEKAGSGLKAFLLRRLHLNIATRG